MIDVGLLVGFRPAAGVGAWPATAGFLVVVAFALVWCVLIALGGYPWSKKLFNREYSR